MFGFVNFHFLTKLFKTTAPKSEKLPYLCTTVTLQNQQTIKLYKHEQSYGIGFSSSALDHLLGSAFNSTGGVFFNQLVVPGVERRFSKKTRGAFQMVGALTVFRVLEDEELNCYEKGSCVRSVLTAVNGVI